MDTIVETSEDQPGKSETSVSHVKKNVTLEDWCLLRLEDRACNEDIVESAGEDDAYSEPLVEEFAETSNKDPTESANLNEDLAESITPNQETSNPVEIVTSNKYPADSATLNDNPAESVTSDKEYLTERIISNNETSYNEDPAEIVTPNEDPAESVTSDKDLADKEYLTERLISNNETSYNEDPAEIVTPNEDPAESVTSDKDFADNEYPAEIDTSNEEETASSKEEIERNENRSSHIATNIIKVPDLLRNAKMSKVYDVCGTIFVEDESLSSHDDDTLARYELYKVNKMMTNDDDGSDDEDIISELDIHTQTLPQGVIINSNVFLTDAQWHTMALVDGELFRCAVCQVYCDRANCDDHVKFAGHLRNLNSYKPLRRFDLSIVRKINNNLHCGVCNEIFDVIDYKTHENGKAHEGNLLTAINKVSDLMFDSNIHKNDKNRNTENIQKTDNVLSFDRNNIRTPDRDYRNDNEFYFNANYFGHVNVFECSDNEDDQEYAYEGEEYNTPHQGVSYASVASKPRIDQPKFLKVDLGAKYVRVNFESWHMIVKPELNKYYCMVCKKQEHIRYKSQHCMSCNHLERLARCTVVGAFEDYLIRKVDEKLYHCGHCNNLYYHNQMTDHIESVHPKKSRNIIDTLNSPIKTKKPTKNTDTINSNRNAPESRCKTENEKTAIINKNVEFKMFTKIDPYFDVLGDITLSPFGSELKISALAFNIIMKRNDEYYCAICDMICADVKAHVEDLNHMEIMNITPFIRPFKSNLTRAVRGTLHCSICNQLILVSDIYDHNIDQPHTTALAIAMGMLKAHKPDNYKNLLSCNQNKSASPPLKVQTSSLDNIQVTKNLSNILKISENSSHIPSPASPEKSAVSKDGQHYIPIMYPPLPFSPPLNSQNNPQFSGPPLFYANFNAPGAPYPYFQVRPSIPPNFTTAPNHPNTAESQNLKNLKNINSNATLETQKQTPRIRKTSEKSKKSISESADCTKTTVDNMKTTADIVKTTAGNVKTTAGNIQATPGNVKTTADNVKTTTDNIKTTADNVKTTADNNESITSIDDEEEFEEFDEEEHCFVCSNTVPSSRLQRHVDSREHTENVAKNKFLDKYGVQLFRQMYLMYHCAICNVLMSRKEIKMHLDWPEHIECYDTAHERRNKKNRKEHKSGIKEYMVETQKEAIFHNVNEPKINIIGAYQFVPQLEAKKDTPESTPTKGSKAAVFKKKKMVILNNVVMKISFDHWHSITCSKNVTKCIICQVMIGPKEIMGHVQTEYHNVALGLSFEKTYYPALVRKINVNTVNCVICNLELLNNEYMIHEHVNGRKHNKNQENIVKESSNSDSYTDCYEEYLNL